MDTVGLNGRRIVFQASVLSTYDEKATCLVLIYVSLCVVHQLEIC